QKPKSICLKKIQARRKKSLPHNEAKAAARATTAAFSPVRSAPPLPFSLVTEPSACPSPSSAPTRAPPSASP
uniref:Uncharacterized protein n=1 Tax=Triticum urartu TaxID=4572 RepID=A0A8R7Q6C2_TRIUA